MFSPPALRRFSLLVSLVLTLSLGSCKGGGGRSSSAVAPQGTGDVALLITDAPSEDYAEILVTVQRVEFLSESRRVETFRGERTIDLLKLRSESILFSLASGVPVDDYVKIRLRVSRVVVVKKDASGNPGEAIETKLPANGKIDLNPRGIIGVRAGVTLIVQVDLDANNSIHVVHAGNSDKVLFRPEVFVKVLTFELDGKLVRLEGFVQDLDREGGSFRLCPEATSFVDAATNDLDDGDLDDGDGNGAGDGAGDDDDRESVEGERRCVSVSLGEDTSIFDPQAFLLPLEQLTDGDKVTVIGHLNFDRDDDSMSSDGDHSGLILEAAVVELWAEEDLPPFLRVKGTVLSDAGDDPDCPEAEVCDPVYDFQVDVGSFIDGEGRFLAQLVEGVKIFGRDGMERDPADLHENVPAVLDAVLVQTDFGADRLRAPLVILDETTAPSLRKFEGAIVSIDPDGSSLVLMVGGDEPGEVCVEITEDTHVILLTVGEGGFDSDRLGVEDLEPDMEVDVFAEMSGDGDGGCVVAQDILTMTLTDAVVVE